MNKKRWKSILNWFGFIIGILGVIFVIRKLTFYSNQIDFSGLSYLSLFLLFVLIAFYCFANIFLALAWYNLLQHLGLKTTKKWVIQTYGISQLAKYVPGNIFQFASRQAIGVSYGLEAIPLIKSTVWEIGLLAFSGVFFLVLVIPLYWSQITIGICCVLFIFLIGMTTLFIYIWIGKRIVFAMSWYIFFLLFAGTIFNIVLMLVSSTSVEINSFSVKIIGVYVVAWLAGLLTPGAPAGIGVRELVFLTLLHSSINEVGLLKAIIIGRFITVGGDVFFYIFSVIYRFGNKSLYFK